MTFSFEITILPEWIDYNGHLRDSYFGLVFSLVLHPTAIFLIPTSHFLK